MRVYAIGLVVTDGRRKRTHYDLQHRLRGAEEAAMIDEVLRLCGHDGVRPLAREEFCRYLSNAAVNTWFDPHKTSLYQVGVSVGDGAVLVLGGGAGQGEAAVSEWQRKDQRGYRTVCASVQCPPQLAAPITRHPLHSEFCDFTHW
jgi:hypothetical protein